MRLLTPPFRQLLKNTLGGFLTGRLLRKALRLAGPILAHADFHGERFRMLRPFFRHNEITRRRQPQRLRHFLKRALIIRHSAVHAAVGWSVTFQCRIRRVPISKTTNT